MELTRERLCSMIDHTYLRPDATSDDLQRICAEARDNHFAMVAINSVPVRICKEMLSGSDVHVGAAISFPLGQTSLETKLFETKDAIRQGADEIDYVINVGKVKEKDYAYIRQEMESIVQVCRENKVIVKVIFENCLLNKEEIVNVAKIAGEVRPDYIKTSTGFGCSGATVEDVRLMKKTVGNVVKVKAAGGIRTWEECRAFIEAGAERIGTSCGLNIVKEFSNQ